MWIGNSLGWQPAFLVVPAINVVLLVILKLTVEETAKIREKGNPLAMGVLGVGMTTLVQGSTLIGEYYANPLL
jgi:predicted MFS family arabinose efflux permease